ncbi:hypothetical protein IWQ62_000058 [Dispira parvispora]|uniref:Peptidase S1 domain-containing protein n=1 Tax=Dispira parvispora TaxID=1520584 RepID=A0A9W8AXN8_9FUNG|nr:hypothetical protein IWQ62_000058 [Dispira parvispora]
MEQGQAPYTASLHINGKLACGASIISPAWLLTAAHCLTITNADQTTTIRPVLSLGVVVGTIYNSSEHVLAVKEVIVHEDFNITDYKNDIALVKLATSLEFNDNVQPIAIDNTTPVEYQSVFAEGWGKQTADATSGSQILHVTELEVLKNETCQQTYSPLTPSKGDQFCTGGRPDRDTCEGDSGGPLTRGPRYQSHHKRILDGKDVAIGDYPFVVHVDVTTQGQRQPCLGTLLSDKLVVTTAECFLDAKGNLASPKDTEVEVVVGSTERSPTNQGEYIQVVDYVVHPNYTAHALNHNIAAVRLKDTVGLSANVSIVKVYNEAIPSDNFQATFIGAGSNQADQKGYPSVLQTATFKLADESHCRQVQKSYYTNGPTLCSDPSNGPYTCRGDASGPLVTEGQATGMKGSTYFLVGLLGAKSAKGSDSDTQCDLAESVQLFTRVAHYAPWLAEQVGRDVIDLTHGTGGEPLPPPPGIDEDDDLRTEGNDGQHSMASLPTSPLTLEFAVGITAVVYCLTESLLMSAV